MENPIFPNLDDAREARHRHVPRLLFACSALLAMLVAVSALISLANASVLSGDATSINPELVAPQCSPNWAVVPSPNISTILNELHGVAVLSANDIWAVGNSQETSQSSLTLIEHWNGVGWNVVASPNSGTHNNLLQDVTAISASDISA